jgi:hypothetical protein
MTIPRRGADVLTTHTLFEVECIERMYLNVYFPGLQHRYLVPHQATFALSTISHSRSSAACLFRQMM